MIKIAIIDDGISTSKINTLGFNIEISDKCEVIQNDNIVDEDSHGTICAMIVKKYAPDATLGSIKILKTYTRRGYVNQFRKAIEWCIYHDISLINISLGSTQSYDYSILYECVKNAYHNGIIIVAALSNKHVVTYPASFQNVIGVETHQLLRDDMYYIKQNSFTGVNIIASSVHGIGNEITNLCNSYAAPLITAKVYQIMNEFGYKDVETIKTILNDKSYKKLEGYDPLYNHKIMVDKIDDKEIKPIGIPCIMIKVEDVHDSLLYSLNNKFNQEGYSTLFMLTDEVDTTDISCHVIIEELSDNTLAYIASKYDADLIIIGFDGTNGMISSVTCDILFDQAFENNETQLLKGNISYEVKVGYKSGSYLDEYIYQKTIKLLT